MGTHEFVLNTIYNDNIVKFFSTFRPLYLIIEPLD
jgi:hypothetical protein